MGGTMPALLFSLLLYLLLMELLSGSGHMSMGGTLLATTVRHTDYCTVCSCVGRGVPCSCEYFPAGVVDGQYPYKLAAGTVVCSSITVAVWHKETVTQ